LNDVSASTRISLKNLQAIENDELSQISSAFFYRSFVRQFAQRLGLDFSELVAAVQGWASTIPEPVMPGQLEASLPKVPPLQHTRPRSGRWLFSLFALILVLAGCSRLYAIWENSRYGLQSSITGLVRWFPGSSKSRMPAASVRHSIQTHPRVTVEPAEKRSSDHGLAGPVARATPNGRSTGWIPRGSCCS
jgi:hypothetical protein